MNVYVASSWRNDVQPHVVQALRDLGHEVYDFKAPAPDRAGFSWRQTRAPATLPDAWCTHCGAVLYHDTCRDTPGASWEPDYDPASDRVAWRHHGGYAMRDGHFAEPTHVAPKGTDLVPASEYLTMLEHPAARDGFLSDWHAMQRADVVVLVLPCGKSAHLELGWAVGSAKRTAVLLTKDVEPELMYLMVDKLAVGLGDLLVWLGEVQS